MTGIFMISLTTSVRRRSRPTSLPGSRRGFRAALNQAPMTDFRRCKQSMLRTNNRPHYRSFAPVLAWLVALLVGGVPARTFAEVKPFSANFKVRDMAVTGGTLHVCVGGSGPAVLLLHGFGDTGDMWQPLAEILVKDHTVI